MAATTRVFTDAHRREALRLRRQGFTNGEIGARMGFCKDTVAKHLRGAHGMPNWHTQRLDEAAALRRQGWSCPRIALYLGFASGNSVRALLGRLRREAA